MPPLNKDIEFDFWVNDPETLPEQPLKADRRRRRRPRKTVRFNEEEQQVREIISRNEFTSQEIDASWYTADDFTSFKRDVTTVTYLMIHHPGCIDDVKYTSRGAECRVDAIVQRRHRWRLEGRTAVMVAQGRGDNVNVMAAVYSDLSHEAVREALEIAILDEEDGRAYQTEECQPTFPKDLFSDEWISSIATLAGPSSTDELLPRTSESINFWNDTDNDDSGFDDSWLRDIAGPMILA